MRRLRQLEEENAKLKRLVAGLSLDKAMLQDVLANFKAFPQAYAGDGLDHALWRESDPGVRTAAHLALAVQHVHAMRGPLVQRIKGSRPHACTTAIAGCTYCCGGKPGAITASVSIGSIASRDCRYGTNGRGAIARHGCANPCSSSARSRNVEH